jgi:hypothetical protein
MNCLRELTTESCGLATVLGSGINAAVRRIALGETASLRQDKHR